MLWVSMGERRSRQAIAMLLLILFGLSTQSHYFTGVESSLDNEQAKVTQVIGQQETIAIGSFPDGAVEKVSISVPMAK